MTLQPSRIVEQMRGIPFFVGKSSSNCSVCGRPLTAHESVARGIGPVCVRKHMGPGAHPSGSPQSVHAGGKGKRKSLAESVRGMAVKSRRLTGSESGIEESFVNIYGDGTKVLVKRNVVGSADSERMAYEFSESVGWSIVPETIVPRIGRFANNESVQRWVEGETIGVLADRAWKEGNDAKFDELVGLRRKNSRMITMDQLLGNVDRHGNNVLVDARGKQWAIDNNLAFGGGVADRARRAIIYRDNSKRSRGLRVTKDYASLITVAKDVRRWSETRAAHEYVGKLEKTHGKAVARQFWDNVLALNDWSRKAKVME